MKSGPEKSLGNGRSPSVETILGIPFHTGSKAEAINAALTGALVLAPSGPGLATDFTTSASYREALLGADINLTDSGYMLLLWRMRSGRKLPRLSGLGYLRELLIQPQIKAAGGTFWVMPTEQEKTTNLAWLHTQGVIAGVEDCYVAPVYGPGPLADGDLLARVRLRQPKVVVITIGGGVQERLGRSLCVALRNEPNRPGIVCIGAAISFLSGTQANIPPWVDRWMLGWCFRIATSPRRYLPRYWRALRLFGLVFRNGHHLPPLTR
ncbi:MAG: hypothetical protein RIQ79_2445 [Verrucomicrobiota bacterium]